MLKSQEPNKELIGLSIHQHPSVQVWSLVLLIILLAVLASQIRQLYSGILVTVGIGVMDYKGTSY